MCQECQTGQDSERLPVGPASSVVCVVQSDADVGVQFVATNVLNAFHNDKSHGLSHVTVVTVVTLFVFLGYIVLLEQYEQ